MKRPALPTTSQLDLAVDLLREPLVERDRLVGADHAVGGLDENRLLAADRGVGLLGVVILVVAAATKDGRRAVRRGERHVFQGRAGRFRWIGQDRAGRVDAGRAGPNETQRARKYRPFAANLQRIDHGVAREQTQPLLAAAQIGHKLHRATPP
jgi:hypothetical protein